MDEHHGKSVTIRLTPEADQALNEFCNRRGLVKKAVVSATLEWLATQPDMFMMLIGQVIPREYSPALVRMVLQKLDSDSHDGEIAEHPTNPKIAMKKAGPPRPVNGKQKHG